MKIVCIAIIALLAPLTVLPLHAQTLERPASTTLQAIVGRNADGFTSCGIRAISVLLSGDDLVDGYDFSITVHHDMLSGLMKAGKRTMSIKDFVGKKPMPDAVLPLPTKFWIAQSTSSKPLASQKLLPAEDKGYVLMTGDLFLSIESIFQVAKGEEMQFSLRYPADRYDRVIAFTATLQNSELQSLAACMESVMGKLKSKLEDEIEKSPEVKPGSTKN